MSLNTIEKYIKNLNNLKIVATPHFGDHYEDENSIILLFENSQNNRMVEASKGELLNKVIDYKYPRRKQIKFFDKA